MIDTIYLDMDGVIVDWSGRVYQMYDLDPAECNGLTDGWDAVPKVVSQKLGLEVTNEQVWTKIEEMGAEFWSTISWLPWGRSLFDLCRRTAPVVLMTTPGKHPSGHWISSSFAGKAEWIEREMPADWERRFALTSCKHHMAHPGALLIDDSERNAESFKKHGGMVHLFGRPWNSAYSAGANPVDDVRELFDAMHCVNGLLHK